MTNFAAFKAGKPDYIPATAGSTSRLQTRLEEMMGNGWTLSSQYRIFQVDASETGCSFTTGTPPVSVDFMLENTETGFQKPFIFYCTN